MSMDYSLPVRLWIVRLSCDIYRVRQNLVAVLRSNSKIYFTPSKIAGDIDTFAIGSKPTVQHIDSESNVISYL